MASSFLSRIDVPFPFISRWRNGERTEDLAQTLADHGTSFCVGPQRSEEPYALMRARTGLWGPWVGNDPGPPGPRLSTAAVALGRADFG